MLDRTSTSHIDLRILTNGIIDALDEALKGSASESFSRSVEALTPEIEKFLHAAAETLDKEYLLEDKGS